MVMQTERFTDFVLNAPAPLSPQSDAYIAIVQNGRTYKFPLSNCVGFSEPTIIDEGSLYEVTTSDTFVGIANVVATTVQLPAGITFNKRLTVADCLGNAGDLAITILPGIGDNIDGISNYRLISNWQSANLQYIKTLNTWKVF